MTITNELFTSFIVGSASNLEMYSNRAYRIVRTAAAVQDLITCGYVRNQNSAGLGTKRTWKRFGERVFWTIGTNKHFTSVQPFLIEADLIAVQKGIVFREHVTAVYTKYTDGTIVNIFALSEVDMQKVLNKVEEI